MLKNTTLAQSLKRIASINKKINAIVHFDEKNALKQIQSILTNFDDYIPLIEKNYEVFFKNYSKEDADANVLTKFSIAIIIALSIEALMVVFKIALHDYSQMVHALYLIMGIALIILSLGIYSYLSKK